MYEVNETRVITQLTHWKRGSVQFLEHCSRLQVNAPIRAIKLTSATTALAIGAKIQVIM